jgi:anion-transporting  ArsA/GET3 family ATPase
MLTAPRTFGEIARVGPIRRQATKVSEMLSDPARTGYVAVALPEEMPVNETLELEARLEDAVGLGLDAIVVNGVWPERFSSADVRRLRAASDGEVVRAALVSHARAKAQRAQVRRLRSKTDAPVSLLPFLFEAEVGLAGYRTLASEL